MVVVTVAGMRVTVVAVMHRLLLLLLLLVVLGTCREARPAAAGNHKAPSSAWPKAGQE